MSRGGAPKGVSVPGINPQVQCLCGNQLTLHSLVQASPAVTMNLLFFHVICSPVWLPLC